MEHQSHKYIRQCNFHPWTDHQNGSVHSQRCCNSAYLAIRCLGLDRSRKFGQFHPLLHRRTHRRLQASRPIPGRPPLHFDEMERWTTWNGPGSLQTPVSPTVEEGMELPEFPTAIKPETADGEVS